MSFRTIAIVAVSVVVLVSCSSNSNPGDTKLSPSKQLDAYRAERAKLDEKIKALEAVVNKDRASGAAVPVSVFTATEAPFEHHIMVKGTIDSRSSAAVAPKMSGQIVALHVQNGQSVKKGQLLAELDADIIQKGIDEVTTQLDFATTLYTKQERIYNQKAGSEIQYLQAKNNKEALEKKLASLNEQLALTRIKAPTSGYVDGLTPNNGEMVMAGMTMMTIVNTSDMHVVSDLSETYVKTVNSGDPVFIKFNELGDSVRTRIVSVAQSINPVNRTFRVDIPLRTVPEKLRPNSTCDITITDMVVPNAIAIPLEAIVRHDDKAYAYVIEGGIARKREIETGIVSGSMVQIVKGVAPNEQVVVRGASGLSDGQRANVIM